MNNSFFFKCAVHFPLNNKISTQQKWQWWENIW